MPHINWKSVSLVHLFNLTQWTDNRMPDKRGTDNRGSTVLGDYNIHYDKIGESPTLDNYANHINGIECTQSINKPIRISHPAAL